MNLHLSEVPEMINRLAIASDDADRGALANLLASDAVLHMPGATGSLGPGAAAITEFIRKKRDERIARGESGRHFVANVVTHPAEDGSVVARSYVLFAVTHSDGTVGLGGVAQYEDHWIPLDDSWRLASRSVTLDHPS